jgi:hypothetical protein
MVAHERSHLNQAKALNLLSPWQESAPPEYADILDRSVEPDHFRMKA